MVPGQDPDARAHVQELHAVEKPAEDPLVNRLGGDQEASGPNPGERPYQDRGAVSRRAVQPGNPRLSRDNRRRKDGRPTGPVNRASSPSLGYWGEAELAGLMI